MAEENNRIVWRKGKKYRLNADALRDTPMYHANHVGFSVGTTGVSLTFSVKLDSIVDDGDGEDGILLPQATCFISIDRAERVAKALLEYVEDFKDAKRNPPEETQETKEPINVE